MIIVAASFIEGGVRLMDFQFNLISLDRGGRVNLK